MNYKVERTINYMKEIFMENSCGHDWWHVYRVYKQALKLSQDESVNLEVVSLAALLHDLEDPKLIGMELKYNISQWLSHIDVEMNTRKQIVKIINTMSYRGGVKDSTQTTLEGMIVQDADRLDAIGAIGIARAFAFGGKKNNIMYDPEVQPCDYTISSEANTADATTINHFYEKLLKLKALMNTQSAKEEAEIRHQFMLEFLNKFYNEWNAV